MENRQYPPTIIQLVADEPSLDLLGLKSPRCGALVLFEGMTRSTTEEIQTPDQPRSIKISDRSVTGLTYNSYKPMFYKVVQKLVGQTRSKWPSVWGIGVIHRVGKCPLGEAGVQVAVTAPHRIEAFEACDYLISMIKSEAPIWKTEHFSDEE